MERQVDLEKIAMGKQRVTIRVIGTSDNAEFTDWLSEVRKA